MLFPNPDFIQDKDSDQYLFFTTFADVINQNYIALDLSTHEEMLHFVSDFCEAFYQQMKYKKRTITSLEEIKEIQREHIGDLETQVQSRVA